MGLMIVTTTDSVDGHRISRYFPPVFVSLSERVGGFLAAIAGEEPDNVVSGLYQRATSNLEQRAAQAGANAILGLRVEVTQSALDGVPASCLVYALGTPVTLLTEAEFAEETANQALIEQENEIARAERAALLKSSDAPLVVLLDDPKIAEEARHLARSYGRTACVQYLRRKASEAGLPDLGLTEADLPEYLFH